MKSRLRVEVHSKAEIVVVGEVVGEVVGAL